MIRRNSPEKQKILLSREYDITSLINTYFLRWDKLYQASLTAHVWLEFVQVEIRDVIFAQGEDPPVNL